MNHAVIGKPRNGKGRFTMGMLVDELKNSNRRIVTNLAIEKLPWVTADHKTRRGLLDYLRAEYGKTFDAAERMFRVTDEAIEKYYLYRGLSEEQAAALGDDFLKGFRLVTPADGVLDESEWQHHKKIKLYVADHVSHTAKNGRIVVDSYDTRLASASGGHVNVVDEAWKFWPARGWSNTSDALGFNFAQVGKFSDDNFLITHRLNDCDSILMDKCQDWFVCTNHGKLNMGWFRQPQVFTVCVYATKPTPSAEPQYRKVFKLDKHGLCECYDTSAGVGVSGRVMADVGTGAKGLPLWVIPVVGIAAIVAAIFGAKKGLHWLTSMFGGHKKTPALVAKITSPALPGLGSMAAAPAPVFPVPSGPEGTRLQVEDELTCVGYVQVPGGGVVVFLSDGTDATSENDEVQYINVRKREVKVNGQVLKIVPRRAFTEFPQYDRGGNPSPVLSLYSRPERPVNDAIILPAIHAQGGTPPPRLNGVGAMNRRVSQGQPNE